MTIYRFLAVTLIWGCLAPVLGWAQATGAPGTWKQLFNGKDLSGWKVKIKGYDLNDNYGDTFRVEDGVLKVVYDKEKYPEFNERFGHLFYDTPFSHYLLHVEYRFVGEQAPGGPGWAFRNSGIMIHGQSPESMKKDQDFPVSVEVQLLGGGPTGEPDGQCLHARYKYCYGWQVDYTALQQLHLKDLPRGSVGNDRSRSARQQAHQTHRQWPDGYPVHTAATRQKRPGRSPLDQGWKYHARQWHDFPAI